MAIVSLIEQYLRIGCQNIHMCSVWNNFWNQSDIWTDLFWNQPDQTKTGQTKNLFLPLHWL